MKTTAIKLLLNAKAKGIIPKPALVAEAGDEAVEMVAEFIDALGRVASAVENFNAFLKPDGEIHMSAEEARKAGYDL